jgi:hypothetical protein
MTKPAEDRATAAGQWLRQGTGSLRVLGAPAQLVLDGQADPG